MPGTSSMAVSNEWDEPNLSELLPHKCGSRFSKLIAAEMLAHVHLKMCRLDK